MQNYKINYNFIIILLGFILEFNVFTFWRNEYHYYRLPIVWMLGGLITSIGLYFETKKNVSDQFYELKNGPKLFYFVFLIAAIYTSYQLFAVFADNKIDPFKSDIVPAIQQMTLRAMKLEYPYYALQFPGWSYIPAYLTMQFLPFAIPEYLSMDYRYFSFIIFLLPLLLISYWTKKEASFFKIEMILKILLPFFVILKILKFNNGIFIHSIELLDVAYYLFLIYAMFQNNLFLKAVTLSFCILSRYGIILWVPVFIFIHYATYGRKALLKLITITFVIISLLYIIPFMSREPMLFFNGMKSYNEMSIGQWNDIPEWYKHVNKPYTLAQGFSFAIYFRDFFEGETSSKIQMIKFVQVISCILVAFLSCIWFIKNRSKLNPNFYLLFTLKLLFTFFYGFLFVPFSYLYLIPLFISMAAIFRIDCLNKSLN